MIGNSPKVKGGITSVINLILKKDWTKENIDMHFIPTFNGGNFLYKIIYFIIHFFLITSFLKTNKNASIYMHISYKGSFIRAYLIEKYCFKKHINVIVHLHGSQFDKWYYKSGPRLKRKINSFLVESNNIIVLGNKWEKIIQSIEPKAKTTIIENAVFIPAQKVAWNGTLNILFMGVLIKRKGIFDLVDVLDKLNQDSNLKYTLLIAGSGPEEKELKHVFNEKKLHNVQFLGWIKEEEKEAIYRKAQMMVLPSYNEGMPMALLEAMSYGLPIVSTDVGDISSLICNGKNGFLVKPGDAYGMVNGIKFIFNNPNNWEQMSKNSRTMALNQFSSDIFYKKIKSILLSNLGEKNV